MNNLNEVLKLINSEYVICGDNIDISDVNNEFKTIKDVRSAAFHVFGIGKATNKNAVLIINGDFLANTYTALTEAWFQKTNLIVIALYNSIYDIETHYLDRCTVSNITFLDKDYEQFKEKISGSLKLIGPKLFNIVIEQKTNQKNYTNILNELKIYLQSEDTVFIYNNQSVELPCILKNIKEKYKYGLFSKYLGYINVINRGKKFLICSVDCLEIDLNILNNRAMNSDFKAIVCGNIEHLKAWIEKNKINLITCKNLTKDMETLYKSNQATILNVKED